MKVFGQIEIDDKQRHGEGENAVGQGIEPAFGNKLIGFSHRPSAVFQNNLRRYVSWRGNPEQSDALLKLGRVPLPRRYPCDFASMSFFPKAPLKLVRCLRSL